MRWVGRPLPRYEDPVLLQGRGRYTADQARGARILRFVRSPVARGRILTVNAPQEVPVITAAGLSGVKPICPRLDRPDYVAVEQPILAAERVTYVGEPIAAVIADTAAEAEDLAERVTVEIDAETPVVTLDEGAGTQRGAGAPHGRGEHLDRRAIRNPRRYCSARSCGPSGRIYVHLRTPGGGAVRDARCRRRFRPRDRPHFSLGVDADAAPSAHRHCRRPGDSRIQTARRGAGGRRRLRPEDAPDPGICRRGVGGAAFRLHRRLDRGPARKSNRVVSRARPAPLFARRIRRGR